MEVPARGGRRGVLALPFLLVLGVAAVRGSALGDEPATPVRLDVTSAEGCPDQANFEGLVRARTRRVLFVRSGPAAYSVTVHMHGGLHASGSMILKRGDVVEGTRSVQAETCADVAEALGLVVTLAIDPSASLAPAPADSGRAPTASASVLLPPPPAAPALGPAPPQPPPAPAAPPSVREAVRLPGAAGPSPHALWVDADFAVATGVSRDPLFGFAPGVGWRGRSSSLLAPSVRLGFFRATTGILSTPQGSASFTWTVAHADGCILSWPNAQAHLLGCARLELGALQGAGTSVPSPQAANRAWAAAGPLVRGEWVLLSPMFVTAEATVMVHVTEDRFFLRPDTTVYQVPLLGFEGGAGLGAHFL